MLSLEHIIHIDSMVDIYRMDGPAAAIIEREFVGVTEALNRQHFFKSTRARPVDCLDLLRIFATRQRRETRGLGVGFLVKALWRQDSEKESSHHVRWFFNVSYEDVLAAVARWARTPSLLDHSGITHKAVYRHGRAKSASSLAAIVKREFARLTVSFDYLFHLDAMISPNALPETLAIAMLSDSEAIAEALVRSGLFQRVDRADPVAIRHAIERRLTDRTVIFGWLVKARQPKFHVEENGRVYYHGAPARTVWLHTYTYEEAVAATETWANTNDWGDGTTQSNSDDA
ncbi:MULTISPECIES: hypothetical protein [Caballeronia]|uniref:hypothetical protein n=1 Tax=Caballeronia TaxID=1827195 RepID=UPI001EF43D87|nr:MULTISPECIES: hypothetical protein [Caballeronia]MCG7400484.1 hypothetical protein [Caballeronia zhejiangensis]